MRTAGWFCPRPRAEQFGTTAGTGWSYGEIARFSGGDVMVFWVSNRAYKAMDWNMERLDGNLTLGIAERARGPG